MIVATRLVATAAATLLVVAACGTTAPSPSPSPTAGASTVPSAVPTVAPSVGSSPTPVATATPAPTAAASVAACTVESQTGTLPSDRLTGVEVLGAPGRDIVRFTFGSGSLTPAGPPSGSLDAAVPPFTEGPSGLPIALQGERALQVVFRGMSLSNDVGQPTYTGAREIRATDPSRSLRHVIIFDESEGQLGWYIGYNGSGCVTLSREGNDVVLTIDFAAGS